MPKKTEEEQITDLTNIIASGSVLLAVIMGVAMGKDNLELDSEQDNAIYTSSGQLARAIAKDVK